MNRENCHASSQEEADILIGRYRKQKQYVQCLVKEEISKHEWNVTQEIRSSDNKSKSLWENIDKLRNKERKSKDEIHLFDTKGNKLTEAEERESLVAFWRTVYQKHDNKIAEAWNQEKEKEYRTKHEINASEQKLMVDGVLHPTHLQEHLDMVTQIDNNLMDMKEMMITET